MWRLKPVGNAESAGRGVSLPAFWALAVGASAAHAHQEQYQLEDVIEDAGV